MDNKKMLPKILLTATILVIAGLLIALTGFAASGFNSANIFYSGYPLTEMTGLTVDASDISDIDISIDMANVSIDTHNKNTIIVEYNREDFIIDDSDGVLRIYSSGKGLGSNSWYRMFRWDLTDSYARCMVTVPITLSGVIAIDLAAGDIDITKMRNISAIEIQSKLGEVSVTDSTIGETMNIISSFGDVRVAQVLANGKIGVASNAGSIRITRSESDILEIFSDLGDIDVEDHTSEFGEIRQNAGSIDVERSIFKTRFDIESDLGDIDFERLECPEIYISSSAGDIEGSIIGAINDYRIALDVSVGYTNLENRTSGDNLLEVSSAIGSVRINFLSH